MDQINDMISEWVIAFNEKDPIRKADMDKKISEEVWPKNLEILEAKLAKNSGWLVGNGMTWADINFTVLLEWLGEKKAETLASFPNCKALSEKVTSNQKIVEWVKKRPLTAM